LARIAVADRRLGILGHQSLQLYLESLMLQKRFDLLEVENNRAACRVLRKRPANSAQEFEPLSVEPPKPRIEAVRIVDMKLRAISHGNLPESKPKRQQRGPKTALPA
jgi:hypothetical protein